MEILNTQLIIVLSSARSNSWVSLAHLPPLQGSPLFCSLESDDRQARPMNTKIRLFPIRYYVRRPRESEPHDLNPYSYNSFRFHKLQTTKAEKSLSWSLSDKATRYWVANWIYVTSSLRLAIGWILVSWSK